MLEKLGQMNCSIAPPERRVWFVGMLTAGLMFVLGLAAGAGGNILLAAALERSAVSV